MCICHTLQCIAAYICFGKRCITPNEQWNHPVMGGAPVRVDNDKSDVEGDDDDDDDDDICLLTASLCRPGQFRCGDGLCVDGSRCLHFNLIQSI